MSSILIIDDDRDLCRSLEIQLKTGGHEVKYANTASAGLDLISEWLPDLVLLDLNLPDRSGIDVLKLLQEQYRDVPVAMITGQQDMKTTIEAMRSGAFDYLRKPFELDDVLLLIEKAGRFGTVHTVTVPIPEEGSVSGRPDEIVGTGKKITEVIKQIGLLSRSRVTVLIEGESGTGKEMVARALHEASFPGQPFVPINCSAIVSTLLESELFGHEKGAFTGANDRKIGKMEFAGEGTLFFDEIGDMPLDLQAKVLRALQEKEFERVGGLRSIPFMARVVAATNRNLETMLGEGTFRRDLYYRLSVARIEVPPLRERRNDVPLLVQYLLGRISRTLHRRVDAVEEAAMKRLTAYDWPGNVRELENVLTRAVALSRGPVLTGDDLEFSLRPEIETDQSAVNITTLRQAEKDHIEKILILNDWNITRTTGILQISPTTLRKKITDYDLKRPL